MMKDKIVSSMMMLFIITIGAVSLSGCVGDDGGGWIPDPYWEWDLTANTWSNITFSWDVIMCTNNGDPEVMMESIIDMPDMEIQIFQEQYGELVCWSNTLDPVYITLQNVLPNVVCNVHTNIACTLIIDKC